VTGLKYDMAFNNLTTFVYNSLQSPYKRAHVRTFALQALP
jgi:hypothetical protein